MQNSFEGLKFDSLKPRAIQNNQLSLKLKSSFEDCPYSCIIV